MRLVLLATALVTVCLGGCAGTPRSSRLSVSDIEATAQDLAAKLSASDLLMSRTADSERMTVAINKVENLTTDVIPESDQWYIMARVRDAQSIQALRSLRNVVFVIPQDFFRGSTTQNEFDKEFASGRRPSHEMSATFRSATRAAGLDRTDAYMCELRVTDLKTRELAWTGIVEFKKVAFGKAYD